MAAGVNGRTYGGGGYILELRGYIDDLQNKIKLLQQVKWTDNRTRSLILEFSSYNAQVNIYRFVYIYVQIFSVRPKGFFFISAETETSRNSHFSFRPKLIQKLKKYFCVWPKLIPKLKLLNILKCPLIQ